MTKGRLRAWTAARPERSSTYDSESHYESPETSHRVGLDCLTYSHIMFKSFLGLSLALLLRGYIFEMLNVLDIRFEVAVKKILFAFHIVEGNDQCFE
jgi:hypothetical protein